MLSQNNYGSYFMTKTQALELMSKGKKITHRSFHPEEWIILRGNIILFHDGYEMFQEDFWKFRTGESWEDGYSVFNN